MRKIVLSTIYAFLLLFYPFSIFSQVAYNYINQPPPGDKPVIFAKGFISKENLFEYPCAFSPNGNLMVFGAMDQNRQRYLFEVKRTHTGEWTAPEKISLTGRPEMEPVFSPDGTKLIFSASSHSSIQKPNTIYYIERHKDKWGKATPFNESINTDAVEYFGSMNRNGDLYFTREGIGIFKSRFASGQYQTATRITSSIKTYSYASHPYIDPDEKFLLFDARHWKGKGSADLYISFNKNGEWTKPVNLGGAVNTSAWEGMPVLSPDGQFLFFTRERGSNRDIYWMKFDANRYLK